MIYSKSSKVKALRSALFLFVVLSINVLCFATTKSGTNNLHSDQKTKKAEVNNTIHYDFELKNPYEVTDTFYLSVEKPRELAFENKLSDTEVTLGPNKTYEGKLSVTISDKIPVGGHESSFIRVQNKKGELLDRLEFISVRTRPHPFVLVTNDVIEEAKQKIENYEWAKNNLLSVCKKTTKQGFWYC